MVSYFHAPISTRISCSYKNWYLWKFSRLIRKGVTRWKPNVKRFKIDFIFLFDLNGKQYDVEIEECTKNNANTKAVEDKGKLTREAKDALNVILKLVDDSIAIKIWIIEPTGSACALSIIDILNNGLYAAKHKYLFTIPTTTTDFNENIITILQKPHGPKLEVIFYKLKE